MDRRLVLSAFVTLMVAGASRALVASAESSALAGVNAPATVHRLHQSARRRTSSGGYVYVANIDQQLRPWIGSVLIYPAGSNGNVAPIAAIAGSNTMLTLAAGIAVDKSGEIYVAVTDTNTIVGFPAGSNGNVTPNIVISGSNTGLASPDGLGLDQAGNLYVANCGCNYGPPGPTSMEEFGVGVNGNVAPIRAISGKRTQLNNIEGLALDKAGFIYVANSLSADVAVFGPHSNGDVAPKRTLSGLDVPVGLATSGKSLFVATVGSGTVERFSRKAGGSVPPRSKFEIDWSGCPSGQSLVGIAAGPNSTIYVAGFCAPLVAQYAQNARGRAQPLAVITGASTKLAVPVFVYAN